MERRHFLKLAFGFAAGGIALAASAQAAPLMPAPLADDAKLPVNPDAQPAVTSGEEVDRLTPEEVRWGRGRHRGWGRRRWGGRRGAAAVGVAGIGAGIAAVVGAAATGVVVATTGKSPPGLFGENKKSPARAGLLSCIGNINKRGSVRSATRCRKDIRDRAAPRQPEGHHDDRGWTNHNGPAIGLAAAIGATMPAGAASAGGFRRAEAGNGAQGQNCCEKVLHVVSRS